MSFYGKAASAADDILQAFQQPQSLLAPLSQVFIHRKDDVPCNSWSWGNRCIAALRGHTDARGYQQWRKVGRQVKKGETAFYILSPCVKTVVNEKTGEDQQLLFGFKSTPVFGFSQTEGDPLPVSDPIVAAWLRSLPFQEVAEVWGISVDAFNGRQNGYLGVYQYQTNGGGQSILLGVKNLSTWTHELVHAADHRNGNMTELGKHWRKETVAELGGAILLKILGCDHEADLGGCWNYIQGYAEKQRIDVLKACNLVLERTCKAVALILNTAEDIAAEREGRVA